MPTGDVQDPSPPRPDIGASLRRAFALHQAGDLDGAERACRSIVAAHPDQFDAQHLLALVALWRGRFDDAERLLARALAIDPRSAAAHANRAHALNMLGRFDDGRASAERALALDARHAEAHYHRGVALHHLGRLEEAVASYDAALAVRPDLAAALANRGAAQNDLGHPEAALASFDRALALSAGDAPLHYNRALALQRLGRHDEAVRSCDRALALRPDFVEAHNNRGASLQRQARLAEALASYERALALRPDFAAARFNLSAVLSSLHRHDEAAAELARALALDPDLPYASGALLHSRMYCCDWRDQDATVGAILAAVRAGKRAAEPMTLIAVADSAADLHRCARTWIEDRHPPVDPPLWRGERYAHGRIRVAYLSADFHEHATAHLMAGLFERHDRARFETTAVSFGPAAGDAIRARLVRAFDRFLDVRARSDADVARLLRELEIDIAVDLKGHTDDARLGILARRPAPVQVHYLGYPGTLGAPYVDYLIADRIVIPDAQRAHYAENVVHLPDSYQVNDATRALAADPPSRAAAGLPDAAFVFCAFNGTYKITPSMFDVWMRLLRRIDGSVLWLFEGNPAAPANLRREAAARGVAPERLVFAPRVAHAAHLARHRLADLFLDTLPCNAHTTASDALWAGLPLVTCLGTTFAGRVAASLLSAVGLPELVVASPKAYEALAVELATDAARLAAIRDALVQRRMRHPLFDTGRFARHIEAAYVTMWERRQRGEPPAPFAVPALPSAPPLSAS
jgi:predicted O-linked N-acetylglucosamine transferase (SPINDLY family)